MRERADRAARHASGEPDGAVIAPEGSLQRALPFLFAVALGLALLPLQDEPVDVPLLLGSIAAIVVLASLWALHVAGRLPAPRGVPALMPFAFLVAIAMLRAGTGGTESGYAALLFLAPLWVALYRTRLQVVLVSIGMFVALAVQGLVETDFHEYDSLRGALLSATIIGMISLAVNRNVVALRQAKARVRREADARTEAFEQLTEVAEALERSNRDLEQFAYVSSHDLQEPLRMIRSFTQLFVDRYGEGVDADGRELLDFVTDGAERAQRLVTDLLEYSRIGTELPTLASIDLDAVLNRACDTLFASIGTTGAVVVRDGDLPNVLGDAALLERLLVNLVGNALRYRHPDRTPEVTVSAELVGTTWSVTVADNGIGFDDEHAERIFKLFQRLHPRDAYGGTGIGLAICERIVELHGGRISATSTPDEGSRFTFTLEAVT